MYEFRVSRQWPYHVSCGGAVYKVENGVRKYALLYRKPNPNKDNFETWHLPKGTLQSDETLEQGARREILEESGLSVEFEKYLGATHQTYTEPRIGWAVDRVIHYFLCKTDGKSAGMDQEHDSLEWYRAEDAIEKLKSQPKNEFEIILRAEKYLKDIK